MSRLSDQITGLALAATGAVLAIAAVATVLLLSAGPAAGAHPAPGRLAAPGRATSHRRGPAAHGAAAATVSARRTAIGTILVGPGGDTLYAFSRDHRRHDACAAIRGCLSIWPMLTVHGTPRAGRGARSSLLSTITVDGAKQVTYAGHPLYTYVEDDTPGDTGYVGESQSGGTWPAVSPSGALVH